MHVAAHVAAWGKRWPGNTSGPLQAGRPPVTFPATKLDVKVELQLGGAWTDVSRWVRYEQKIRVMRGRRNEQTSAVPQTCELTFNNNDGRFSPRNATGPYAGLLGKNTPIRIGLNPGSGESRRFTGEIPDWPPTWRMGEARFMNIVASGPLRRLQQGTSALRSPMFYSIRDAAPVTYHPLEDGVNSTQAASGLLAGAPADVSGVFTWAGETTLPGSKPNPVMTATSNLIASNLHVFAGHWQVDWFAKIPAAGLATEVVIMRAMTTGTPSRWEFVVGSGYQALHAYDSAGTLVVDTGHFSLSNFAGDWLHFRMEVKDAGGGQIQWGMVTFPVFGAGVFMPAPLLVGVAGDCRQAGYSADASRAGVAYGHLVIYDAYDFSATDNSARAWAPDPQFGGGETPAARFTRICAEAGIPSQVDELIVETEKMGAQTTDNPLDLLRGCEDVNRGVIDETLNGVLRLSSRTKRYIQAPALTIDYTTGAVALKPRDDDFATRNDWTVTRAGGTTARVVQEVGPLNVQSPASDRQGVGRYADSAPALSLGYDAQVLPHAGYRVARGTIDELRFSSITFRLHRNPELIPQWLACDNGSRLIVTNPPAGDVGPESLDQIIEGSIETIDQFEWTVEVNASPNAINKIGVYDATVMRYDCAGSTLAAAATSSQTTIDVGVSDNCTWAHDNGDYDITVGGEAMNVSGVGASIVDTFGQTLAVGWGSTDTGESYVTYSGVGAPLFTNDWQEGAGVGTVAQPTNAGFRVALLDAVSIADIDLVLSFSSPVVATGDALEAGGLLVRNAGGTSYLFRAELNTDTSVTLKIFSPSSVTIASQKVPNLVYGAGTLLRMRAQAIGSGMRARCWLASGTEPEVWHAAGSDTERLTAGSIGIRAGIAAANTNAKPITFTIDNLQVTNPQRFTVSRSSNGVVKAHAIAEQVRLRVPSRYAL